MNGNRKGIRTVAGLVAGAMLAGASGGVAAGRASVDVAGEGERVRLDLAWRDATTVRMDFDRQPAYMLVRDGKVYSVSTAEGRTMVMDMSAMQGMMGNRGGQSPRMAPDRAAEVAAFEPTGETEEVAGIEGQVYRVVWRDGRGRERTDEAVLSGDGLAVEMSHAWRAFAAASGGDDMDALGRRFDAAGKGVLRFGDTFRVTELSGETPPAARFELPAEPMQIPGMGGMGRGR